MRAAVLMLTVAALAATGAVFTQAAGAGPTALCAAGPCAVDDYDGDKVKDYADNCPLATNPSQRDTDHDAPTPVVDQTLPSPIGDQTGPVRLYPEAPAQSGYPTPADFP